MNTSLRSGDRFRTETFELSIDPNGGSRHKPPDRSPRGRDRFVKRVYTLALKPNSNSTECMRKPHFHPLHATRAFIV